ncbi:MAG: hypothetical protein KBD63_06160 [Bacteriovoracaceae bacterium]|nr:hypothetical protein [Bacteriovoracaceae bacterium]
MKKIEWEAPSNIAIIKYWGKKENQIPQNVSVSFSLKNCKTRMSLSYEPQERFSLDFLLAGKLHEKFEDKIRKNVLFFAQTQKIDLPYKLKIESENTFPHSAGIASSASSQAALSLCLQSLVQERLDLKEVSKLARNFSGSACRSLYAGWNEWGFESLEYATPLKNIHPLFQTICDSVLVVDPTEKKVLSSQGHQSMEGHPYASARYSEANKNAKNLISILQTGNWNEFTQIAQAEALHLHSLMLTALVPYTLLKPHTWEILNRIMNAQDKIKMTFTLDAGPNVHLLYPLEEKEKVLRFIKEELSSFFEFQIDDEIGVGPCKL